MLTPPDPVPIKSLPEAGISIFPRFTLLVETQVRVPAERDWKSEAVTVTPLPHTDVGHRRSLACIVPFEGPMVW
jgi:hypothetical protein